MSLDIPFYRTTYRGTNGAAYRLTPFAAPQTLPREDDREEAAYAEHDERPDKKMMSAGIGDPAGGADTSPAHVYHRNGYRKERSEKHDDVSRQPFF